MAIIKKNGKYYAEVAVGGKTEGGAVKRTRRVAKTRAGAKRIERELKHQLDRGLPIPRADTTVESFLNDWLKVMNHSNRASNTKTSYSQIVRDHVIPCVGHHRLINLHQSHVNHMVKTIGGKGLGANSQRLARRTLSVALTYAERNDLVIRNVAKLSDPLSAPIRRELFIQPDQIKDLFAGLVGHRYEDIYILLAHTGVRRGEALAVKWSDIHLDDDPPWLLIERSYTNESGKYVIKKPKTKTSNREVPISPDLQECLRERKKRVHDEQFLDQNTNIDDNFVFAAYNSYPPRGDTVTKQLATAGQLAGIPHLGPHQLRHLHSTMLLEQGLDINAVSKHLGHSNISTTANIYAHPTRTGVGTVGRVIQQAFDHHVIPHRD